MMNQSSPSSPKPHSKTISSNQNEGSRMSLIQAFDFDDAKVTKVHLPTKKLAAFNPISQDTEDMFLDIILDLSDDIFDDNRLFGETSTRIVSPTSITPTQDASPTSSPSSSAQALQEKGEHYDVVRLLEEIPVGCDPQSLPSAAELVESDPFNNTRKRPRQNEESSIDETTAQGDGPRFREYQADQWSERFRELVQFQRKNGHCVVPHTYTENLPLARWVKRQRYQYNQFMEGGDKPSTMTEERIQALENIGFVWNCQGSAWEERLNELREYKEIFLDCNVPTNYQENPKLAMWVKCQRRQYKLFLAGQHSSITTERINILEGLGFTWGLRNYGKKRRAH